MNLVLALLVLGGSGSLVWAGITDPEDGFFGGLANLFVGEDNRSRAEAGLTRSPSEFAQSLLGLGFAGSATASGFATAGYSGAAATGLRAAIIADARTWAGVPYVWGGTTKRGADCSGFLQTLFKGHGITLPRVSYMQATTGQARTQATAQPGDIVAFGTPVHHVGLYIGNGRMIHSSRPGRPNAEAPLSDMGNERRIFRDVIGARGAAPRGGGGGRVMST